MRMSHFYFTLGGVWTVDKKPLAHVILESGPPCFFLLRSFVVCWGGCTGGCGGM